MPAIPSAAAKEPQTFFSIAGARLITRTNPAGGAPLEALGPYIPLIFPVAVAAAFGDIYIADAGASRLYRYDRGLDAFAVIKGARVGPATRLQAGPDGSIYVLDPFTSLIHRFNRGGAQVSLLHPARTTSRYSEFAVHPLTGKVYAVDSAHLSVDQIEPLGGVAMEFLRIEEPGPIAITDRSLYLAGPNCGCVNEWINGRLGRRFGAGQLRQPRALAIVGPQIYGLDGERNVVLIHEEGVDRVTPRQLGMLAPESLSATQGMLLIADGAGRRVVAYRSITERS